MPPYPAGESTAATLPGTDRTFRIYLPSTYQSSTEATPPPLLFAFHGGFGSGFTMEAKSHFDALAEKNGFVVVYPDATSEADITSWNAGSCCGPAALRRVDDIAFVASLYDHLVAELCVDQDRVFAAGHSNGGMLSYRVGCELSDLFAGVAAVEGAHVYADCAPTHPVSVYVIHGTLDSNVPYAGGAGCGHSIYEYPSVAHAVEVWVGNNDCASPASTVQPPLLEQGNGVCRRYSDCAVGGDTVLCTLDGTGHGWPSTQNLGETGDCGLSPTSRTFDASGNIW
eukprot:CAMPEP_0177655712 /NCGR_PEP_ID=MMETSP0447-20121125/15133_1 /TAXON_ID=0 /ORGANISM="Stygamoeba regulata, Strain BSH-02190019" /LENGTH=282 /DNA_ID=CAMNT_0019159689 /DNA_START=158 /DNA_END=1003 /DNA_ORIENTATION=-